MLSTLDNKDSQGTSGTITRNQHGALFHAPAMFSPGVESEPQIRDDNNIGSEMLPMEYLL